LVLNASESTAFDAAEATFVVPNIAIPTFASNLLADWTWNGPGPNPYGGNPWEGVAGSLRLSIWVGLDGVTTDATPDRATLWQAEVFMKVSLRDPSSIYCSFTWEVVNIAATWPSGVTLADYWLEGQRFLNQGDSPSENAQTLNNINNVDVSPGDLVLLKVEKADPRLFRVPGFTVLGAAKFTFTNLTTNLSTVFTIGANAPLYGYSAEWIVERPWVRDQEPGLILPAYGAVYLDDATFAVTESLGGGKSSRQTVSISNDAHKLGNIGVGPVPITMYTENVSPGTGGTGIPMVLTDFASGLTISEPTILAPGLLRCTYELEIDSDVWDDTVPPVSPSAAPDP
jgi:hypothetical protein